MIKVPSWVASMLDLEDAYTDEAALHAALSTFEGNDALPYVGADDLVAALAASSFMRVDLVRAERSVPWRFAQLSVGSGNDCVLVELPGAGDSGEASPPSATVRALIRAWITADAWRLDRLIERHKNNVLVAWEIGADGLVEDVDLCLSLAGVCLPAPSRPRPLVSCSAVNIAVPSSALVLKDASVYHGIIQQALQSSSESLRFLHLYRIFERAYLIDALEKLKGSFFDDPQQSIKIAKDTVANERNSFIALIQNGPAEDTFADIERIFSEAVVNLENRFMLALSRAVADESETRYRESWKVGCALIYKMRCAIVHSGKNGPIFESFRDSMQACERVNDSLEKAAFLVLGVGMS